MAELLFHRSYEICGTRVVEVHFGGDDWMQEYRGESGIKEVQDDINLLQDVLAYLKTGDRL